MDQFRSLVLVLSGSLVSASLERLSRCPVGIFSSISRVLLDISLWVVVLACGLITPLRAEDALDCTQRADPELAIRACTDIIIEGYINRGIAYNAKGDHDGAVTDFEKAFRLNNAVKADNCAEGRRTDAGVLKFRERDQGCPP
jgi:hypothetical protein